MAEPKFVRDNGCKEAVCVDAGRVYDSCCEEVPTSTASLVYTFIVISNANSSGKAFGCFI